MECKYPFQNPELPFEERIENLLELMTIEEKVQCLDNHEQHITRLGFSTTSQVEGYHGVALGTPGNWGKGNPIPTTQFCQAIGLGETWDPELVRQAVEAEAVEFRYAYHKLGRGGLIVRAPNADLGRDPRWGRTEECFGEDPYFNSVMTVAVVKGLQGDHPRYIRAVSLLKHFLANSNEDYRTVSSSNFDERLFREYYSYPFMKGFTEGGAFCYMTAYNLYNGVPCTINPFIREITMKEWGVDGIVCTDGGALGLLVTDQAWFEDNKTASAACIKAGTSQFLDPLYSDGVREALEGGLIDVKDIDEAVRRNLRVMMRLGLFDPPQMVPYTDVGDVEPWNTEKHRSLAREVTKKSIVLLKNDGGLLPLDDKSIKRIAVIGKRAEEVLPDWYGGDSPYKVTPLEGIRSRFGKSAIVDYVPDNGGDGAVNAASQADVAIVILGNDPISGNIDWTITQKPSEGREATDRETINLEAEDEELLQKVFKVNKNTILVLVSSFPYAINQAQETIPAILHMTQASQEMGNALAEVLCGDYNPAGRLVQTWPKSLDRTPEIFDYDIRKGRTYMYFDEEPLYPFGFGLSYTRFKYSNLKTSANELGVDDSVTVSVDVDNIGNRDGEEVVQMYVEYIEPSVQRPKKQLKGFRRVYIKAGETASVTFILSAADTAYWNIQKKAWTIDKGKIRIRVGGSSSDLDLKLAAVIKLI